jgi:hypothetical protein
LSFAKNRKSNLVLRRSGLYNDLNKLDITGNVITDTKNVFDSGIQKITDFSEDLGNKSTKFVDWIKSTSGKISDPKMYEALGDTSAKFTSNVVGGIKRIPEMTGE